MDTKAQAKHIRTSPRKLRLVVDLIRGMEVDKALDQLKFSNKNGAKPVAKLLNSAIANALNNFELSRENLLVKEIRVDDGTTLKRWMPRAHGRATPIRKRASHISIVLGEIKDSGDKKAKKQKIEKPVKLSQAPTTNDGVKIASKDKDKKEKQTGEKKEDVAETVVDPRMEGHGKHAKIEGKTKGFAGKLFRRKSG